MSTLLAVGGGVLVAKFFWGVLNLLIGLLLGGILGFMIGKGINPVSWVTSFFKRR